MAEGVRTVRRSIVLGGPGSPKRRVRLDALEAIAKQLQETLAGVADDLGLAPNEVGAVELVDLVDGSGGLVFEQIVPAASLSPLEVVIDATIARSGRKRAPRILTARALQYVDDFLAVCDNLRGRGIPVSIETPRGGDEPSATGPSTGQAQARYVIPDMQMAARALAENVVSPGEVLTVVVSEGERWILRFTGMVQRLDGITKQMWIRHENKPKALKLSDEQFATADGNEARWQRVLVSAVSQSPAVESITEVLSVSPAAEDLMLEATPTNKAAELIAPTLARIATFAELPPGWDSYSAVPIAPGAVAAARSFLVLAAADLRSRGVALVLPFAAPVGRGSVQLEWELGDRYLEIEFVSEKMMEYMRSTGGASAEGPANTGKLLELVAWLHERDRE